MRCEISKIKLFDSYIGCVEPVPAIIPMRDVSFCPVMDQEVIPFYEYPRWELVEGLRELAKLNGRELADPNDPLVKIVLRGLGSTDIATEPLLVVIDGARYVMKLKTKGYIPASYLNDVDDGQQLCITLPVELCPIRSDHVRDYHIDWYEGVTGELEARIDLDQSNGPYAWIGSFRQAVDNAVELGHKIYDSQPKYVDEALFNGTAKWEKE